MRDCVLYFHVICRTSFGQEVRIIGNHPELGAWDLNRSLILTTQDYEYPRWKCAKRIKISKKFNLQFKVWISEKGKLKRWENFPNGQNRHYCIYLKSVRLVIIADTSQMLEQHRERYVESQEFFVGDEVRKFNQKQLVNDEENSSSSFDGFDDFYEFEDFSPKPTFNLDYIVGAFKEITSRLEISETKKDIKAADGRTITLSKKVVHVSQVSLAQINPKLVHIPVQLQINDSIVQKSIEAAKAVIDKLSSGECLVFHQFEMCLILKAIRKIIGSQHCYKMGLFINNLESLSMLTQYIEKEFIVQSLILSNGLLFPSFEVMNEVLDLIESVGVTINIQFHKLGLYTATIYDRPILMRVIDEGSQYSLDTLQFFEIHPDSVIKKRIQNIRSTQEDSRHTKVICFSFGPFESFSIIRNNKELINRLCQTHLIYVITPTRLKQHAEVIALFPKILFVSYMYLEMEYMKTHKTIDGVFFFSSSLAQEIQKLVYQYPLCTYEIWNNVMYVRNTDTSTIGINGFQRLAVELEELINHTNRSKTPRQNKSLTLTRVNGCTIMIRQIFQTQVFLSKLILQTIQSKIDFVILFLFNRFENFRFLQQLKLVVSERYYNTSVLAYTLGYVKNRHCYNLFGDEFTEILEYLQKCVNNQEQTIMSKRLSIKY